MASGARRELFSADAPNDGRGLRSTASPASKLGGAALGRDLCCALLVLPSQLSSTDQIAMANDELHVHVSPGSAGSTNSCLQALAQDTQRVFRIPHRLVLDLLLAHLGLSLAQFERDVHEEGTIRVTVLFNTSALDLGGPINDISVLGAYSTDDETAEDTVAIKVVRYVEDMTNTVVRDINLASSQRHQHRAERLHQELKESRINNMQLARGWLLAVKYMHYFSMHVRNAVAMGYSVGNLPDTMEDISSRLEEHLEARSRY